MSYTPAQAAADTQKFLEMAQEAEAKGDQNTAGLYRVEAHNCIDRVGMRKAHKSNLGPYNATNPKHCMHCKKPGREWVEGEECVPATPTT